MSEVDAEDEQKGIKNELTYDLIEKTVKVYKCHRSCLDTDFSFVKSLKNLSTQHTEYVKNVFEKMTSGVE